MFSPFQIFDLLDYDDIHAVQAAMRRASRTAGRIHINPDLRAL
jgi:hypothetical protein